VTALAARGASNNPLRGQAVNLRLIDWIWHVRGSLPLPPGQSSAEVFARLDPLFRERGTTHEHKGDSLSFRKKDQPAQDKMSVFDSGVLRVEKGAAGPVLRYHLVSRALLFCFVLPPLFLGIGQLTIVVGNLQKPPVEAASGKGPHAAQKPVPKIADVPMNPIDKMLGAPAPDKKKGDKPGGRNKKPSATSAYVFAGMFAALYLIGRVLEDWLVRRLFRKRLLGA
jgi:hypothetical protein